MLQLNPNCKVFSRDEIYVINDYSTGKYYQINAQQYRYIISKFCPDAANIEQTDIPQNEKFETSLLAKGILVEESSLSEATAAKKKKRFVYTDLFHFRFSLLDPNAFCEKALKFGKYIYNTYFGIFLFIMLGVGVFFVFQDWDMTEAVSQHMNLWYYMLLIFLSSFILAVGHELSHALICKKYGGNIRDTGIAILYFSPCFYCNVSDSYLFKKKSQRIMVSLIGIIYDIAVMLATVIFLHYVLLIPSTYILEYIRFNIIMLLSELNPLLKHDGYYVLTEAVSTYNLRENAIKLVKSFRKLSSKEKKENRVLIGYGLFSLIYLAFYLYTMAHSIIIVITKLFL